LLTGIHFLLTYMCNLKCDHCFIYSGPNAKGTFTLNQIQSVLNEAAKINTIEWIYFEGGEPFLYYPRMLEGIRISRSMGFKVGVLTN
jgi:MoaA/NifB/PqqE/SkfB family radical SAM enzyme